MTIQELQLAQAQFETTSEAVGLGLRLNVSELVIRGMKTKGWSVPKLSVKADVSRYTIQKILDSEVNCTLDTVGRLFHALEMKAHIVEVTEKE